jgi:hypothetical protein
LNKGQDLFFKQGIHEGIEARIASGIIAVNPAIFFEDFAFQVFAFLNQLRGRVDFRELQAAKFGFKLGKVSFVIGYGVLSHESSVTDFSGRAREKFNYFLPIRFARSASSTARFSIQRAGACTRP